MAGESIEAFEVGGIEHFAEKIKGWSKASFADKDEATQLEAGLMSAADKTALDAFVLDGYEALSNKPQIESVTLSGNKLFPDLGVFKTDDQGYSVVDEYTLTTMDINALWANSHPIG